MICWKSHSKGQNKIWVLSADITGQYGTDLPGDGLDLLGAQRLEVHTDVALHGSKQMLPETTWGVGFCVHLLPPGRLIPARDDPLVFAPIHILLICLQEMGWSWRHQETKRFFQSFETCGKGGGGGSDSGFLIPEDLLIFPLLAWSPPHHLSRYPK